MTHEELSDKIHSLHCNHEVQWENMVDIDGQMVIQSKKIYKDTKTVEIAYWRNGKLHREAGPAFQQGQNESYWLDGKMVSIDQHRKARNIK